MTSSFKRTSCRAIRFLSWMFIVLVMETPILVEMPLMGAPREEAKLRLSQAVHNYRRGFFKKSTLYLRIAEKIAPRWANTRPEVHKLRALLYLADGRPALAADDMVYSVRLKPDPFLFYLLGEFNLGLRSTRQARNSYRSAVISGAGPNPGTGVPPLPSRLPFICPVYGPAGRPKPKAVRTVVRPEPTPAEKSRARLQEMLKNPFADYDLSGSLWNRTLRPEELALSAYQALALTRYIEKGNAAELQRMRGLLQRALGKTGKGLSPGARRLLQNPDDDTNHRYCLHALEALERREKANISLGVTDSAKRLRLVREHQRRVHRNRIAWFGSVESRYAYGSFLLQLGRGVEALHVFRGALTRDPLRLTSTEVKGNLIVHAQIYRHLELVYQALGRVKDANVAASFAGDIENFQNSSLDFAPEKVRTRKRARRLLVIKLLRRARRYLKNREGLLFLISHAQNAKDGKNLARYRRKLKRRDAEYDEQELLSAFREYY